MARRYWSGRFRTSCLAAFVTLGCAIAHAQPLGIYRWQFQPYCNVVSFAVVQQGPAYVLTGTDHLCGADQTAPATGTAVLNPDGTIGLGFTVVLPGGRAAHVSATIAISGLSGTWHDADGYTGAFAFNGAMPGGAPRPAPIAPSTGGAISGPGRGLPALLVPQHNFTVLDESVQTPVAGQLLINKTVAVEVLCSVGGRWYYLAVNGFPLRSSVVYRTDSEPLFRDTLTGVTDAVLQPGTHTIGVAAQCAVPSTYLGNGAISGIASSSVVVIP